MLALLFFGLAFLTEAATIRLEKDAAQKDVFVLRGADPAATPQSFSVRVDSDQDLPPLSGSYERTSEGISFRPRYPLQGGMKYRASWRAGTGPAVETVFAVPKVAVASTARVEHIYPSAAVLPANQLKLYIQFSAPMSRGEAWRRIHLLDHTGKEVSAPFLEIEEELWDPGLTRLTVLFDPGRIKRGLAPNNQVGPALVEGRAYQLLVDRDWPDGKGAPLLSEFRKEFRVKAADRTPPTLAGWRIQPPPAGTRQPLRVELPEAMDAALLKRLLWAMDPSGNQIPGDAAIESDETVWTFTPDQVWRTGQYQLRVGMTLEDLAGNRIDRAFDVDTFERVEMRLTVKTRDLPFTVPAEAKPR